MVTDPNNKLADPACMILSNLTRTLRGSEEAFKILAPNIETLVDIFCNEKFNQKGAKLHYLGPLFSNLSQLPEMREYQLFFYSLQTVFIELISFYMTEFYWIQLNPPCSDWSPSLTMKIHWFVGEALLVQSRTAPSRLVYQIRYVLSHFYTQSIVFSFSQEFHQHLFSESIDLLPKLLLPLAGPEEFDDEDNDKLPIDLQYLGAEKTRERDPDLRKIFIETLTQASFFFIQHFLNCKDFCKIP